MSEQQIRDGFERMEGALAPPRDTLERVDRQVRSRRRRRRTAVVGVAAVAVIGIGGTVAALAGGGDPEGGTTIASDPGSGPTSTLVMTRPDGSTVAFEDVTVSCSPPVANGDQPIERPRQGRIWAYSPIAFAGSAQDDEAVLEKPFLMIEGNVAELQAERTFELPIDGPGDSSTYPMVLFIADTEGGTPDDLGNEAASSASGSGTVRVLEATCDPVPVLRLEVDGVIGSEEGKDDLGLAGSIS